MTPPATTGDRVSPSSCTFHLVGLTTDGRFGWRLARRPDSRRACRRRPCRPQRGGPFLDAPDEDDEEDPADDRQAERRLADEQPESGGRVAGLDGERPGDVSAETGDEYAADQAQP